MNTGATEKQPDPEQVRQTRARAIVAMQLVEREGDLFFVKTPAIRRSQQTLEVRRDSSRRVVCSCREFGEEVAANARFRCEHILAVKFYLEAEGTVVLSAAVAHHPATGARAKEAAVAAGPAQHCLTATQATGARHECTQTELDLDHPTVKQPSPVFINNPVNDGAHKLAPNVIGLHSFTATLKRLRQQIDPSLIKSREAPTDQTGQSQSAEDIEWEVAAEILDRVAPAWQHHVRSVQQIGNLVVVTAAIVIDGVSREGVGTGTAENEEGIKCAEHDALKRAAAKFGIARDLHASEAGLSGRAGATDPGDASH